MAGTMDGPDPEFPTTSISSGKSGMQSSHSRRNYASHPRGTMMPHILPSHGKDLLQTRCLDLWTHREPACLQNPFHDDGEKEGPNPFHDDGKQRGRSHLYSEQCTTHLTNIIYSTNNHDCCKLKVIETIIYIAISLCYLKCSIATPIISELMLHMLESCSMILSGGKNTKLMQDMCVQNKYNLTD